MKTYCFNCCQHHEYERKKIIEEETIGSVTFSAPQWHCYCRNCGKEVFPESEMDENTIIAHDAYREAMGIISVKDMQLILDTYKIGARPLSLLLGWGENTIERQMKHSVPDIEHSNRLKSLLDPANMITSLVHNGDRISESALRKAFLAAFDALANTISETTVQSVKVPEYQQADEWNSSSAFVSAAHNTQAETSFQISYESSSRPSMSPTNPFDYPDAA